MQLYLLILVQLFLALFVLPNSSFASSPKKVVYLPVIFHAHSQLYQTGLCLNAEETNYLEAAWWNEAVSKNQTVEDFFKKVIEAIKSKNRKYLAGISLIDEKSSKQNFDMQIQAYIELFDTKKIISVSKSYYLGDMYVFNVKYEKNGNLYFSPFAFLKDKGHDFKFLLAGSIDSRYSILRDWLVYSWEKKKDFYCSDEQVKLMTHKFNFDANFSEKKYGSLFFRKLDDKNGKALQKINDFFGADFSDLDKLKNKIFKTDAENFSAWISSASPHDKEIFSNTLKNLKPFFVIDADPLYVVYLNSENNIEVYYLIEDSEKLFWVNGRYITAIDKIFKQGMMFDEAKQKKPFLKLLK
jgi:hypothetical protein